MDNNSVVVLVTAPSRETARQIARHVVENRLAACASILGPVESIYTWQGAVQAEEEVLLIIKTRAALVEPSLIPAIKSIHPYDVPEIIALPVVSGLKDYLGWINEVTQQSE